MFLLSYLLATALLGAVTVQDPDITTLDLTTQNLSCPDQQSGSGEGGGSANQRRLPKMKIEKVEVSLAWLDKVAYREDDPAMYELTIVNNNRSAEIQIPWSIDSQFCNPVLRDDEATERTSISLRLKLRDGATLGLMDSVENLYGSPTVPGSMLTLKPGAVARLKAKARWKLLDPSQPVPSPAILVGQVDLRRRSQESTLTSRNTIQVVTQK
jgi:hypothetical protein